MLELQTTPKDRRDLGRCAVTGGIPVGVVGRGRGDAILSRCFLPFEPYTEQHFTTAIAWKPRFWEKQQPKFRRVVRESVPPPTPGQEIRKSNRREQDGQVWWRPILFYTIVKVALFGLAY